MTDTRGTENKSTDIHAAMQAIRDYFGKPPEERNDFKRLVDDFDNHIKDIKPENITDEMRDIQKKIMEIYAHTFTSIAQAEFEKVDINKLKGIKDFDGLTGDIRLLEGELSKSVMLQVVLEADDQKSKLIFERYVALADTLTKNGNFYCANAIYNGLVECQQLYKNNFGMNLSKDHVRQFQELVNLYGKVSKTETESILVKRMKGFDGPTLPVLAELINDIETKYKGTLDALNSAKDTHATRLRQIENKEVNELNQQDAMEIERLLVLLHVDRRTNLKQNVKNYEDELNRILANRNLKLTDLEGNLKTPDGKPLLVESPSQGMVNLVFMSENDFKGINEESRGDSPVLVKKNDGNYQIWGYKDHKWQLTNIDKSELEKKGINFPNNWPVDGKFNKQNTLINFEQTDIKPLKEGHNVKQFYPDQNILVKEVIKSALTANPVTPEAEERLRSELKAKIEENTNSIKEQSKSSLLAVQSKFNEIYRPGSVPVQLNKMDLSVNQIAIAKSDKNSPASSYLRINAITSVLEAAQSPLENKVSFALRDGDKTLLLNVINQYLDDISPATRAFPDATSKLTNHLQRMRADIQDPSFDLQQFVGQENRSKKIAFQQSLLNPVVNLLADFQKNKAAKTGEINAISKNKLSSMQNKAQEQLSQKIPSYKKLLDYQGELEARCKNNKDDTISLDKLNSIKKITADLRDMHMNNTRTEEILDYINTRLGEDAVLEQHHDTAGGLVKALRNKDTTAVKLLNQIYGDNIDSEMRGDALSKARMNSYQEFQDLKNYHYSLQDREGELTRKKSGVMGDIIKNLEAFPTAESKLRYLKKAIGDEKTLLSEHHNDPKGWVKQIRGKEPKSLELLQDYMYCLQIQEQAQTSLDLSSRTSQPLKPEAKPEMSGTSKPLPAPPVKPQAPGMQRERPTPPPKPRQTPPISDFHIRDNLSYDPHLYKAQQPSLTNAQPAGGFSLNPAGSIVSRANLVIQMCDNMISKNPDHPEKNILEAQKTAMTALIKELSNVTLEGAQEKFQEKFNQVKISHDMINKIKNENGDRKREGENEGEKGGDKPPHP